MVEYPQPDNCLRTSQFGYWLMQIGGSGVLISPLTYIFDEETPRWRELLLKLGI